MSKLNRKSVFQWLENNEEIGKEIVANFLSKRPLFCKEILEQQSQNTIAARRLTLHRLSIVGAPGPLLPFAGDESGASSGGGGGMKRFTSGPIILPKKSTDQLRKLNKQDLFMELLKDVVSPDFDVYSLSHKILVNVLLLIDADRSSLFFVEGSKENPILISRLFDVTGHSCLESVLHDDSEAIKIPFGVGIVGQVAKTGKLINLKDAYDSPHFNTEVDRLTGYRTKSLLCMPIKTPSGEVIGVAQVINKYNDGEFTEEDVEVFNTYMTFCAIGLTNSHLFELSFTQSRRLQMLLELTKKLFEDTTSIEEMIKCIMSEALKLIPCEKCIVLVVDKKTDNDVTFKIAIQFNGKETETLTSIAPDSIDGYDVIIKVAKTCEQIITNDDGARQSKTALSISSNSMLCMPVFNDKGDLMAIVKLDNKLNGLPFNDMEQESFQVFSMYCGLAIHNVLNYEKIIRANAKQTVALEVLSYHAAASLEETDRLMAKDIPKIKDIGLVSYKFDDLTLTDDGTILASVLMFKEMGFTRRFHIDEKSLYRWVLTVRKNYRPVLYHNWRHAFNVAQAMFTIMSGRIGNQFTDIEKLSLLIACFSHDLDHRGTNNAFQSKIESPLAQLYTTSTMEHHHFNHCIMILNCDRNKLLQGVSSETYEKIIRVIEDAILSTDLSLYFKKRSKFFGLINSGLFDSSDVIHRDLLRGMLMTACDVAAVSKPWPVQRRVADLVMQEFFEQGDIEREDLNLTPVAIMDRRKIDELPQMQAGFIKGVCLPLYKVLSKFSHEFLPLSDGAQSNLNAWEERINSPGIDHHGSFSASHPCTPTMSSITGTTPTAATATSTVNQGLGLIEAWTDDNINTSNNNSRRHKKCIVS